MVKILVIDDEPLMRRVTSRVLQNAGHAVVTQADGRAGIEQIKAEPPDLLITDIFMPEMEGLETIRQARALRPNMPIIAMSGVSFSAGDYLPIAEKFGAVASLRKPFAAAELLALVNQLLAAL